ncbi:MAG TPA: DUF4389 domain-containing protein [Baekduia sp.]|nr:DUF4389 domain-containing protein [Baekduia sp.]
MSNFPVDYEADYVEERSRLTTFFRGFMVIPHMIVGFFLGIAAFFTIIAAWFAVVVTGKYPDGLYSFHAGLLRWSTRVNSYYLLATDAFPPFGLDEEASYPVRLRIAPPKSEYNRLHAFFRMITAIPSQIVLYALSFVGLAGAIAAWFVILVTGKTSPTIQMLINMYIAYSAKASSYMALMHEEWFPPIGEDANASGGVLPPGGDRTPTDSGISSTTTTP